MTLTDTISWTTTGTVVLGMLGTLSSALLVFKVVLAARDLFGRKPTLDAQLEKREQLLRLELQTLDLKIVKLRQDMDSKFESFSIERQRDNAALHDKVNSVAKGVAFIQGHIEQCKFALGNKRS